MHKYLAMLMLCAGFAQAKSPEEVARSAKGLSVEQLILEFGLPSKDLTYNGKTYYQYNTCDPAWTSVAPSALGVTNATQMQSCVRYLATISNDKVADVTWKRYSQ